MTTTPPLSVSNVGMLDCVSIKAQHANAKKLTMRKRYEYGNHPCTFARRLCDRQPFDPYPLDGESFHGQTFDDGLITREPFDGCQPFARQPFARQSFDRQPFDRQPFDPQPFDRPLFDRQPFDRQPLNCQLFDSTMFAGESYVDEDSLGVISISDIEADAKCDLESLLNEAVDARVVKKRCFDFAQSNSNMKRQDKE